MRLAVQIFGVVLCNGVCGGFVYAAIATDTATAFGRVFGIVMPILMAAATNVVILNPEWLQGRKR